MSQKRTVHQANLVEGGNREYAIRVTQEDVTLVALYHPHIDGAEVSLVAWKHVCSLPSFEAGNHKEWVAVVEAAIGPHPYNQMLDYPLDAGASVVFLDGQPDQLLISKSYNEEPQDIEDTGILVLRWFGWSLDTFTGLIFSEKPDHFVFEVGSSFEEGLSPIAEPAGAYVVMCVDPAITEGIVRNEIVEKTTHQGWWAAIAEAHRLLAGALHREVSILRENRKSGPVSLVWYDLLWHFQG